MATSNRGGGRRVGLVQRRAVDSHDLDPFYTHLVAGMEEALDRDGSSVLVVFEDGAAEEDVYRRWGDQGEVDVVVLTDLVAHDPRPEICRAAGLDAVVLGTDVPEGMTGIAVAELPGARVAAAHLLGLGHRRLGHVTGPVALLHTAARVAALAEVRRDEDAAITEVEGDYSLDSGRAATARLLDGDADPTAIMFDNDLMAIGGMQELAERGLRIPEDVSVLAWDDSAHCQLAEPPISALSRDVYGLGIMLGEFIAARSPDARVVEAPHAHVIHRGSTAAAPR